MPRNRRAFSDLQKTVLRFALKSLTDSSEASVYYVEVLAALGWRKEDIQLHKPKYERALSDLDDQCGRVEKDGIVKRLRGNDGQVIGVSVTSFGIDLARRSNSIVRGCKWLKGLPQNEFRDEAEKPRAAIHNDEVDVLEDAPTGAELGSLIIDTVAEPKPKTNVGIPGARPGEG